MTPELNSRGTFHEQFSVRQQYRNETRYTLSISLRSGVRLTVPRSNQTSPAVGNLIVRSVVESAYEVKTDVEDQYIAGKSASGDEALAWLRATGNSRDGNTRPKVSYANKSISGVSYLVHEDEILEAGGAVYIRNLDISVVIVDGSGRIPPPHPYTRLGSIKEAHRGIVANADSVGCFYGIRIIDRKHAFGSKFVNLGGRVCYIKAEAECADNLEDGVYLTTPKSTSHITNGLARNTEFFTFTQVKSEIPLFDSYAAAQTLGNPEEVRKRELDNRQHELAADKLRFQEEQQETKRRNAAEEERVDRERREYERELNRRQDDLKRRQAEQEEREFQWRVREQELKTEQIIIRNNLDGKSETRKVMLEFLKFIPAVIGAVVTVGVTYSKLKDSRK